MDGERLTWQEKAEIDEAMMAEMLERERAEKDSAEEAEHARLLRYLGRRERRQWKARAAMPMHGKHLLRGQQRQRKRRNEHIREW